MILRRTLLAALVALVSLPALAQDRPRIIVVRHADRDQGVDELNATGIARAAALPGALEGLSIDAIYVLDRNRNHQSAEPLSRALGLPTQIIEERHISAGALAREILRRHPTGTTIWIGNTGNLTGLWKELQITGSAPTTYGDIKIVEITNRMGRVVEQRRFEP